MVVGIPDSNASIYLTKAGLWDIAINMFDELWFDNAVYDEAVDRGKREGMPDAFLLEKTITKNVKGMKRKTENQKTFMREKMWFIGSGETSVYILASENTNTVTITSDIAAKRKLEKRGVAVLRTDEMVFMAYETGKVSYDEFLKLISKLRESGGTTSERVAILIKKAGEVLK